MSDFFVPDIDSHSFAAVGVLIIGVVAKLHFNNVLCVALGFELLTESFKALPIEHLAHDLYFSEGFKLLVVLYDSRLLRW